MPRFQTHSPDLPLLLLLIVCGALSTLCSAQDDVIFTRFGQADSGFEFVSSTPDDASGVMNGNGTASIVLVGRNSNGAFDRSFHVPEPGGRYRVLISFRLSTYGNATLFAMASIGNESNQTHRKLMTLTITGPDSKFPQQTGIRTEIFSVSLSPGRHIFSLIGRRSAVSSSTAESYMSSVIYTGASVRWIEPNPPHHDPTSAPILMVPTSSPSLSPVVAAAPKKNRLVSAFFNRDRDGFKFVPGVFTNGMVNGSERGRRRRKQLIIRLDGDSTSAAWKTTVEVPKTGIYSLTLRFRLGGRNSAGFVRAGLIRRQMNGRKGSFRAGFFLQEGPQEILIGALSNGKASLSIDNVIVVEA